MKRRKQITFDIDTNVAKQIFGEQNYTKIYADIRNFMDKERWKHIEGSVYVSGTAVEDMDVFLLIKRLKNRYPYMDKCVREMHQTNVSKVHSLNYYFAYDGTPGQYEQKQQEQTKSNHKKSPPKKTSVRDKLKQNQEIIKRQEEKQQEQVKHDDIEKSQKPRDRER